MSPSARDSSAPTSDGRQTSAGPVGVLALGAQSDPPVQLVQSSMAPAGPVPFQGETIEAATEPEAPRVIPEGELISGMVAGRVAFSAVDGPGKRYLLLLQGCQLDCLACPRPMLMPPRPRWLQPKTVDDVLADICANAPFLAGVTVSGGEPTIQPAFVGAVFRAMATCRSTSRLTRFVATNGNTEPEVWAELAPLLHGVMVDLSSLDDEQNVVLTGRSNYSVLATIENLAERDLLHEVRLMLVPGINDSDADLRRVAAWLLGIDPQIRVRVVEFRRRGTRACARDLSEPRRADFIRYWRVLSGAGIDDLVVP